MAVLKKIKASTLMETLVATILLIIIFMVSSLTVNNLFGNTVKYDTRPVITYMNELEYQYRHRQLPLPYTATYKNWDIAISGDTRENILYVTFEAIHPEHRKTLTKTLISHAEAH